MRDDIEENNLASDSEIKSLKHAEAETSKNLPKNVSLKLFELMNKVVSDRVTPQTVDAACKCASEIHKILKFNLEVMRQERKPKDVSTELAHSEETLTHAKLLRVREALEKCHGNKTRAAEMLQVSIRSLRNWVSAYEILAQFRHEDSE